MPEIVVLTGKTRKGKNRVHEHGSTWVILRRDEDTMLVESQEADPARRDLRWIATENDPNFHTREL